MQIFQQIITSIAAIIVSLQAAIAGLPATSNLAQVSAPTNGLAIHYNFDEGSGTILTDQSGNNNNGTINGATWTTGVSGGALSFDGVDDYVDLPNGDTYLNPNAGTIAMWYKANGASANDYLYSYSGEGGCDSVGIWALTINSLRFGHNIDCSGTESANINVDYISENQNDWHFIAFSWDAETDILASFYDGFYSAVPKNLDTGNFNSGNSTLFASNSGTSKFFNGSLDQFRIYNRALSESEINNLYDSISNPTQPTPISEPTPEPILFCGDGSCNGTETCSTCPIDCGTCPIIDNTPPTISITSPTSGSTLLDTVTITANASDDVAVSGVQFKLDSLNLGLEDTLAPYSISWDTTKTTNGSHLISATARDAAGNTANASTINITINNQIQEDTQAPTIPTNLSAIAISPSQINLTWNASADNIAVTGYKIYRDGILIATTTNISYFDTNLSPSTQYIYTTSAYDAVGNYSEQSSQVKATTLSSVPIGSGILVPLTIKETESITRDNHPITMGVPFPQGVLTSLNNVRILNASKIEIPVQKQITATWNKYNSSIKWALFDFKADVGANQTTTYYVEYGPSVMANPTNPQVFVSQTASKITVNTGPLQFSIDKTKFTFIDEAVLNGETIITPGGTQGLYVTDQNNITYKSSNVPGDYSVIVEDSGLMRAQIKATGWYVSSSGEKRFKYEVRFNAYAGEPIIKVYHTFIFSEDAFKYKLKNIAIKTPLQLSGNNNFAIGGESGIVTGKGNAYLLQDDYNHYSIKSGSSIISSGSQSKGWMDLNDGSKGVAIQIRDMWQNYPLEIEANGNELITHIWPAHGDYTTQVQAKKQQALNNQIEHFWPYHEGGLLDLSAVTPGSRNYNPSIPETFFDVDRVNNAIGIGKTHELVYYFHTGNHTTANTENTLKSYKQELMGTNPSWFSNSGAFRDLLPADYSSFAGLESNLEGMFDTIVNSQRKNIDYGMVNYGDAHYSYDAAGSGNRYWLHYRIDWPNLAWTMYVRTGDPKYLNFGIASSRHLMDIDTVQVNSIITDILGNHVNRFIGGYPSGAASEVGSAHWKNEPREPGIDHGQENFFNYYYLTGYKRAKDVLNLAGQSVINKNIILSDGTLSYWGTRDAHAMALYTGLYQLDWDDRFLKIANAGMKTIQQKLQLPNGIMADTDQVSYSLLFSAWPPDGLDIYRFVDNSQSTKDSMVKFAKAVGGMGKYDDSLGLRFRGAPFSAFDFGYKLTGDLDFISYGKYYLDIYLSDMEDLYDINSTTRPNMADYAWAMIRIPHFLKVLKDYPGTLMYPDFPPMFINMQENGGVTYVVNEENDKDINLLFAIEVDTNDYGWQTSGNITTKIIDPEGTIISNKNYVMGNKYDFQPGDTVEDDFRLKRITIPADQKTGEYQIYFNADKSKHMVALLESNINQVVIPISTDGVWLGRGRYFFYVPSGTSQFSITSPAPYWHPVTIYNPSGNKQSATTINPQTSDRDKLWSFILNRGDSPSGYSFVKFSGLINPVYLSLSPQTHFQYSGEPINNTPATTTQSSNTFAVGQRIQTTDNLKVRSQASLLSLDLGTQISGSLGTVISGGLYSDGYYWWNIDYDNAPDGWSVENYLSVYYSAPVATSTPSIIPIQTSGYNAFNLKVINDRWPDFSSLKNFGESVIRIMGAITNEEKALAIYRMIQQSTMIISSVPKEPIYGINDVVYPEKLMNVYGTHYCDGITRILEGVWRALGYRAEKNYFYGHTISDLFYKDSDNQNRWHSFDSSANHWFVWNRNGNHIATPEELALDISLVRRPEDPINKYPISPAPPKASYIHSSHLSSLDYNSLYNLRNGESVTLYWGNIGKPYYTPIGNDIGGTDFEHGPYQKNYGNAEWIYTPDFNNSGWTSGLYQPTVNVSIGNPKIHPTVAGSPSTLIYKFSYPYIISDAVFSGSFKKGTLDSIKIYISADGVNWTQKWNATNTGEFSVENVALSTNSYPPSANSVPFGRYDYYLKIEMIATSNPSEVGIDSLTIKNTTQHNIFSLPQLWPVNNNITVNGNISNNTTLKITYTWSDFKGSERKNIVQLENLPYSYQIKTDGVVWNDVVSKSLKIEAIPRVGTGNMIIIKEAPPSNYIDRNQNNEFLTTQIIEQGGYTPSTLKTVQQYISDIENALKSDNFRDPSNGVHQALYGLMVLRDPSANDAIRSVIFYPKTYKDETKIYALQALYLSTGASSIDVLSKVIKKDSYIGWTDITGEFNADSNWAQSASLAALILSEINNAQAKALAPDIEKLINENFSPLPYRWGEIKWSLIRALGLLGNSSNSQTLIDIITPEWTGDEAPEAARALGNIGDPSAIPALHTLISRTKIQSSSPNKILYSIEALGKLGDKTIIPDLYQYLNHSDEDFRGYAAEALGRVGDLSSISYLQNLLAKETFSWVKEMAQNSINILNGSTPTTILNPTPTPTPTPSSTLSTTFLPSNRIQVSVGVGSNLNVRASASATGTLLGTQSNGALGTIVSGGNLIDGYYWWYVNFDNAPDGYVVEDYLITYTAPTPTPTPEPTSATTSPSTPTPTPTPIPSTPSGGTTNTTTSQPSTSNTPSSSGGSSSTSGSTSGSSSSSTYQTPTIAITPVVNTYTFTRNLSRGSEGQDVTELQKFLVSQNYTTADNITGYFGPITESALKKFQADQGVVSYGTPATTGYGNFGPMTRTRINSLYTSGDINTTIQNASTESLLIQIRALQELVLKLLLKLQEIQ